VHESPGIFTNVFDAGIDVGVESYVVALPLLQLGIQCDTEAKMAILTLAKCLFSKVLKNIPLPPLDLRVCQILQLCSRVDKCVH
jgi:hypothetical protein